MRLACIDIGSNTTRLLVAEREAHGLRAVGAQRHFTAIGASVGHDGVIDPAKLDEIVAVVAGQTAAAHELGAGRTRVVGTAVLRDAPNRRELIDRVRAAAGVELEILEAGEEARLAFVGAAHDVADGRLGVVDVGGGSTELAVGWAPGSVSWWTSVPLGSGNLAARHLRDDPPAPAQLEAMRAEISEAFSSMRAPHPQRALAVGGSATSLHRLTGGALDPGSLGAALVALTAERSVAVARHYGLEARRVALLPAGLELLRAAAVALGVDLQCGRGGLREGVLLEEFARG